jgi:hypothetical protein
MRLGFLSLSQGFLRELGVDDAYSTWMHGPLGHAVQFGRLSRLDKDRSTNVASALTDAGRFVLMMT